MSLILVLSCAMLVGVRIAGSWVGAYCRKQQRVAYAEFSRRMIEIRSYRELPLSVAAVLDMVILVPTDGSFLMNVFFRKDKRTGEAAKYDVDALFKTVSSLPPQVEKNFYIVMSSFMQIQSYAHPLCWLIFHTQLLLLRASRETGARFATESLYLCEKTWDCVPA